ncbi:hypothetical protein ACQ4LE_001725 [Meloidogyne hapla]|uniref:Secreted protein n=1 Tax=Meloidogyne hapla TaxID=6305 RepID=A0A1I8B3A0_MELHA
MLIIIPLIFLINLTVKGESISLGDIHKIANNFASLTSATSDWLADIKKITNNSKHFIKICGPAGALVALGFDIAFPSDSPEQKAITQLHKDVMEKFKALDVTLQSMEGNILHKLNLVPYKSVSCVDSHI